ncbi:class I SAM-dependent methyltransferase [Kribbella sp. VKM Ac-2500]|uniref:class I SAM-dependent methyltransferase n=1 Tax=Kribbella sp. VKM Ac-2500 TaxID=2512214 RepID=UPI003519F344
MGHLGAIATGIDISDVAVQMARRPPTPASNFRQADILDLPADLVDVDLIYLSWGAICWVPDLSTFAQIVATRLRPGGSILLADHHPLWEVLAVEGHNHLSVAGNYFARTTPRQTPETNNAKLPTDARNHPTPPPFSTFIWPTSDVITASSPPTFTSPPSPNPPPPPSTPPWAPPPRLLLPPSRQAPPPRFT